MTAWRFLFFSLILHLLIWLFLLHQPSLKFPDSNKQVEVEIIDKRAKGRPVVRQALPPLNMLKPEPPKNPKYLSERDQSVKKEMQAPHNNQLTQNGNSNVNSKGQQGHPGGGNHSPQESGETGSKRDLSKYAPGPLTNAPSAAQIMTSNGEYLPDATTGPINALNTERFVYYSFFSRIEERLRPLWERNVEDAIQHLPPRIQKQLINRNWITSLEILVDPEGHYLDAIILQSCGVPEVDQAAIRAFADAKFFPNPPKEMVKADNKIHLNYAFIVEGGPSGWNRPTL